MAILTIVPVSEDFSGAYTCTATNKVTTITSMTMVNVDVPPKIIGAERDGKRTIEAQGGENVVFNCHANGDPQPVYTWTHNGVVITDSPRFADYILSPNGTLTITNIDESDAGTIRCTAHNHLGLETAQFYLRILRAPQIKQEIGFHRVEFGSFMKLECELESNIEPEPNVKWTLNSRKLESGRNFNGRIIIDGNIITFTSMLLEDTGMISCLASNEVGVVGSVGEIVVFRNGKWATWSDFEPCSASCGEGVKIRNRICSGVANGGDNCPDGSPEDTQPCNNVACPIDGQLTVWSDWSACSVSCGRGAQSRERQCIPPTFGGMPCVAELYEEVPCNYGICDIDGNWAGWYDWESCDRSCGGGIKIRSRECNAPAPTGNGLYCLGSSVESRNCNGEACPVDGDWGSWGSWAICSKSCGVGERARYRYCDSPEPRDGGMICSGIAAQVEECNLNQCPIDGDWSNWADWTMCSRSCDGGVRKRKRTCTAPLRGGKFCQGHAEEKARCNTLPCPADGNWSAWSDWAACSVSCGRGMKARTRNCSDPPPVNGGDECIGISVQRAHCHIPCKKTLPVRIEGKIEHNQQ